MWSFYGAEGVLLHCKRGPFAPQNESFCEPKRVLLRDQKGLHLLTGYITVNKERCYEMVKNSIGIVTALNPIIGYKASSKVQFEVILHLIILYIGRYII